MNDRTEHQRRVYGSSVKRGLFVLNILPECLFGQGLGGCGIQYVTGKEQLYRGILTSVLVASWSLSALFLADLCAVLVPVLLGETTRSDHVRHTRQIETHVCGAWTRLSITAATELQISRSAQVGVTGVDLPGNHDSLNIGVVLLDRLEHTDCTVDSWVKQFLWIVGIHVERRSSVGDTINTLDGLVESAFLRLVSYSSAPDVWQLTCPMSSTITYSKGTLDPLKRLTKNSPLSLDLTVPTTG